MNAEPTLIAVDGGQTAVKIASGTLRTEYPGLRTNTSLTPQLADDINAACDTLGTLGPFTVAIGTTGLTSAESDPQPLLDLCRGHGVSRVLLAHDSISSYLGALGFRAGVVCAAGTGVVTLGVGDTAIARVDGWGNLIGDAGSGYWIGRAGLDAVMRAYDGRGPETALTPFATREWPDLSEAYIALQTDPDRVRLIASFSEHVAELADTDAVAAGICRAAGRELAASIATALRRTGQADVADPLVCLIGGVFHSNHVDAACVEALRADWPRLQPTPPQGVGIDGAIALASLPEHHPLAQAVRIAQVA